MSEYLFEAATTIPASQETVFSFLFRCCKPHADDAAIAWVSNPHTGSGKHAGRSAHRLQDSASRAADALADEDLPLESAI